MGVGGWALVAMTTDWQRTRRLGKRQVAVVLAAIVAVFLQGCGGGGGGGEEKKEVVLDDHIRNFLDEKPVDAIVYMVCIETVDLSVEKIKNATRHKLDKECREMTDKIENLPEGKHRVEKKCKKYGLHHLKDAVTEAQPPLRMNCTSWGNKQIRDKLSNSSAPQLKDILEVAEQCFEDFEKDHPESIQFAQTVFDIKVEKARAETKTLIDKLKKAARETMKKQLDALESEEKFDLAAPTAKDIAVPARNSSFSRTVAACVGLATVAGSAIGLAAMLAQRRTRSQSHASRPTDELDISDESGTEELTALHTLSHPLANIRMAE